MSQETKRKLSLFAGISFVAGFLLLFLTLGMRASEPVKEVTLVAKEMAFYLEAGDLPNPTLKFQKGDRVRIHFINQDPGIAHDVVFPNWNVSTGKVNFGDQTQVELKVSAPGEFEYLCSLHATMMWGKLLVSDASLARKTESIE